MDLDKACIHVASFPPQKEDDIDARNSTSVRKHRLVFWDAFLVIAVVSLWFALVYITPT